jgi:hypothetical protein
MARRVAMVGFTLVLTYSCFAAGPVLAQSADLKLLPADGFTGAWKKSAPPRTFTSADLYGHINGGAELFLELGFEQLTVQKYKDGANELGVEIYRMADATAARAIYVSRRGKETPDPSLKARHTASRHQLQFQRDRYYVIVNNMSGGTAVTPVLVSAAAAVVQLIPADGPIPSLALLPKAGLVSNSERIIRGTFTLQAVFTLGEGDILSLGGGLTAMAGDYKSEAGASTLVVAEYPTPAAASAAFAHLTRHLDTYLKPVTKTSSKLVFQDFEKKYGVATVAGKRLEIRLRLTQPPQAPRL